MMYPVVSPWGKIYTYNLLCPDFFYVSTNLQDGFLFSQSFADQQKIEAEVLSGHSFSVDMYAFDAVSDAMMLVLSSKRLAWHIYRNYCSCSEIPSSFSEFFSFAKYTVKNYYPSVYKIVLKDSASEIEKWVSEVSEQLVFPWLFPNHPFYRHTPTPIFVPAGWSDACKESDLQASIVSNDGWFFIFFASQGIPYYIALAKEHPLLSKIKGAILSDYDIFSLIGKSNEIRNTLLNGIQRYDALMSEDEQNAVPFPLVSAYRHMVSHGDTLEMLFLQVFHKMPMAFPSFSSLLSSFLPEAIISPAQFRSALCAVKPIICKA